MTPKIIWVLMGLVLFATPAMAGAPKSAPPVYTTANYALTFQVPAQATYCPLPDHWVGSDHGTTLFVVPPKHCADENGYASSGRMFTPGNTPRIEVFYGYYDPDDVSSTSGPCPRTAEWINFLGDLHRLCPVHRDGLIGFEVSGPYPIAHPGEAQATLTVLTTRKRLRHDVAAFRKMVASTRNCAATWVDQGKTQTNGQGAPCPANTSWF